MEKNRIFLIIVIVLMVVLLGAIVFLGITLGRVMSNQDNNNNQVVALQPLAITEQELIELTKPIVSNLKKGSDGADHVNQVTVSVGVSKMDKKQSPVIINELNTKQAILRDICGTIIRNKTVEELRREDGQEILKQEILEKIQQEFQSNLIYAVYFADWYLE